MSEEYLTIRNIIYIPNDELLNNIQLLFDKGLSKSKMCKELNITDNTCRKLREGFGLTKYNDSITYNNLLKIDSLKNNHSIEKISKILDIDYKIVEKYIGTRIIRINSFKRKTQEEIENEIIEMIKDNNPKTYICNTLNISLATYRKTRDKYNIKIVYNENKKLIENSIELFEEKILNLFEKYQNVSEVAECSGVKSNLIKDILIKYKIKLDFPEKKRCAGCNIIKPQSKFGIYSREYYLLDASCKDCRNDKRRDEYKNNPHYKLHCLVSSKVTKHLKLLDSSKNNSSVLNYLDYKINELKSYIESKFEWWMTWDNWGIYDPNTWDDGDPTTWRWQLDHIIPQSKLPYDSMEHENFKKCWSKENLRPYSAKQNVLDGVTKIRHKDL